MREQALAVRQPVEVSGLVLTSTVEGAAPITCFIRHISTRRVTVGIHPQQGRLATIERFPELIRVQQSYCNSGGQ